MSDDVSAVSVALGATEVSMSDSCTERLAMFAEAAMVVMHETTVSDTATDGFVAGADAAEYLNMIESPDFRGLELAGETHCLMGTDSIVAPEDAPVCIAAPDHNSDKVRLVIIDFVHLLSEFN